MYTNGVLAEKQILFDDKILIVFYSIVQQVSFCGISAEHVVSS